MNGQPRRIQIDHRVTRSAVIPQIPGRYRYRLERDTGQPGNTILWIGMNPAQADEQQDDETCRKEFRLSMDWSYARYLKCNMVALWAPNTLRLPDDPREAVGPQNIEIILAAARESQSIVLACGNPRNAFYGDIYRQTIRRLWANGRELRCLRKTKAGWPFHPAYLNVIPFRAINPPELYDTVPDD